MILRPRSRRLPVPWPVVLGIVVVGLSVAARASPQSSGLGRIAREVEAAARQLPATVQEVRRQARERFAQATTAFDVARSQSERVLAYQLQEAKKRGSLPPV